MNDKKHPLGLIAGGGMLPLALVRKCQEKGIPVAIVALRGFANGADFSPYAHIELPIGRGRSMIRFFREQGVRDIVMIGAVRRPSFWDIQPDFWTLSRLGKVLLRDGLGDDGLLRFIKTLFEQEGFRVQGIQAYLPELIAQKGALGKNNPTQNDMFDIRRGFQVAWTLGLVDVGQSVVIQSGIVLGVEAAEGTAELIHRCAELKRAGPGPVLIKCAKPNQDHTLDLPTIGPDTIRTSIKSGFRGIAIQAGGALVLNPVEISSLADQNNLFVYGHDE